MPNQRDIITVDLGKAQGGEHPAIVISNNRVHAAENACICAMMTTSVSYDVFSFILEQEMLMKRSNRGYSQVRCQLLAYVPFEEIIPKDYDNQLNLPAFKLLLEQITNTSLSTRNL